MTITATTEYCPPTPAAAEWLRAAEEQADQGNHDPAEFRWYFDPAFPLDIFWCPQLDSDEDLRAIFDAENARDTAEGWDRPENTRPDEQYYDSYWGWWNAVEAKRGANCPIIVFGDEKGGLNGWDTWDGWHRMLIARLAHIKSVPVIVGIRKR